MGQPVSLGDVQVRQGDVLVGDADGIVVVPQSREREVLETAQSIEEAEQGIEAETARGTRLDDARTKHRYHALQARDA